MAFILLLLIRLLVYLKWEVTPDPVSFWLINAVFIPMGIFFADWIRLQYQRSGMVVMLLRLGIVVAGLLEAYYQLLLVMPSDADISLPHHSSALIHSPEWPLPHSGHLTCGLLKTGVVHSPVCHFYHSAAQAVSAR